MSDDSEPLAAESLEVQVWTVRDPSLIGWIRAAAAATPSAWLSANPKCGVRIVEKSSNAVLYSAEYGRDPHGAERARLAMQVELDTTSLTEILKKYGVRGEPE